MHGKFDYLVDSQHTPQSLTLQGMQKRSSQTSDKSVASGALKNKRKDGQHTHTVIDNDEAHLAAKWARFYAKKRTMKKKKKSRKKRRRRRSSWGRYNSADSAWHHKNATTTPKMIKFATL